jgi:hypothetical protein
VAGRSFAFSAAGATPSCPESVDGSEVAESRGAGGTPGLKVYGRLRRAARVACEPPQRQK